VARHLIESGSYGSNSRKIELLCDVKLKTGTNPRAKAEIPKLA